MSDPSDSKTSQPVNLFGSFRSDCALAKTLDIVGDKWSLVVIRDLMMGASTYGDLQNRPESIPTNILAARLKRLQSLGMIEKVLYQERPNRYRYALTDLGWSLKPVLLSIAKWGLTHIEGSVAPPVVRDEIAKMEKEGW